MIAGIHHIKLPVSDVARSRAWYQRVLGFETEIEFVEDGEIQGVAIRRDGCQPQIALRHDPDRARALSDSTPSRCWCLRARTSSGGAPHSVTSARLTRSSKVIAAEP